MQPVHLDRYENYSSALKDSLYCVLLGKGVLVCCAYPTSQLLGTHYRGSTGRVPCLDRQQDASLLQGTQVCPAQLFTWHKDPCKAPGKNFQKHSVTSVPLAIFVES